MAGSGLAAALGVGTKLGCMLLFGMCWVEVGRTRVVGRMDSVNGTHLVDGERLVVVRSIHFVGLMHLPERPCLLCEKYLWDMMKSLDAMALRGMPHLLAEMCLVVVDMPDLAGSVYLVDKTCLLDGTYCLLQIVEE